MRQKGFILLPVIIIIALLGVVGYLVYKNTQIQKIGGNLAVPSTVPTTNLPKSSSTPDPTANWKTYTSPQYGYTIKYPSTVTYKQDRFYLLGDDNRKDTADGFGPELMVLFRGNDLTPTEAVKQELKLEDSQFQNIDINNATGVKISNPALGGFDYYLYPKIGSGNVIRLSFSPQSYSSTVTKESISKMQSIAVQMLSTFKFSQ